MKKILGIVNKEICNFCDIIKFLNLLRDGSKGIIHHAQSFFALKPKILAPVIHFQRIKLLKSKFLF